MNASSPGARGGFAYGLGAFAAWGVFPLFWKLLAHVPALELVFHRVVWAFVFVLAVVAIRGQLPAVGAAWADLRVRWTMIASAGFIAANWFAFVYAVATDRVLEISLGYFINPLVSVALGALFLRERLRPGQWIALGIASVGVLRLAVGANAVPWISLCLAFSFGMYGLLRKTVRVDPLPGSVLETAVLSLPALSAILWLQARGQGHFFAVDLSTTLLMVATGVVTATPLWWFANAVRRLALSTIGFMQYLAPTLQFGLAVLWFGEPFDGGKAVAFACIWVALGLFALEVTRAGRPLRKG